MRPIKLFVPCFIDQLAPGLAVTVAGLLDRLGTPWEYPATQTCCGQFALTVGDFATARRLMRHYLEVFAGTEAVVCPSASCTLMVRHYYPALAEGPRERRRAEALAGRTWELSEWLAARGPLSWEPDFAGTLALHRSCKAHRLGVLPNAARLLSQVKGLTLTEVSPYYACCGFGGAFRFQHPDLAGIIGQAYLEAVLATGARGLVSLDPGCLLHLRSLAVTQGLKLDLYYLAEVLLGGLKTTQPKGGVT